MTLENLKEDLIKKNKNIDPFLIFCAEQKKINKFSDKLTNSDIISFLGSKWRSLKNNEKEKYKNIAEKLNLI